MDKNYNLFIDWDICISSEALRIGLTIIFCKIEIVIDKTIIYLEMFKHVQILETFNLLGVFLWRFWPQHWRLLHQALEIN